MTRRHPEGAYANTMLPNHHHHHHTHHSVFEDFACQGLPAVHFRPLDDNKRWSGWTLHSGPCYRPLRLRSTFLLRSSVKATAKAEPPSHVRADWAGTNWTPQGGPAGDSWTFRLPTPPSHHPTPYPSGLEVSLSGTASFFLCILLLVNHHHHQRRGKTMTACHLDPVYTPTGSLSFLPSHHVWLRTSGFILMESLMPRITSQPNTGHGFK